MDKNYWAIHMGAYNAYANIGYEKNFVGVGWNELKEDLSKYNKLDKAEFFEKFRPKFEKLYPKDTVNGRAQGIGQLFRFVNLIKVGDIILMPKTDEGIIYIGVVKSDYYLSSSPEDNCNFAHRRNVNWIKTISRSDVSEKLINSLGSIMTVFSVSDHALEIEKFISEGRVADSDIENIEDFGMESHLEDFIIENWEKLPEFRNYKLLQEDNKIISQQYVIKDIGRIDILARSKDDKEWLVIELKKGKTADDVVGQTLRYVGWVMENQAKQGEKVKGIIISGNRDEKLRYALMSVNNIVLMTYSVNFKLNQE